jgi:L-ascorbate metabolism protein UlaG (beta-lactamase superfamily)
MVSFAFFSLSCGNLEINIDAYEENNADANNPSTQSGIFVAGSYSTGGKEYGAYWTNSGSDGSWQRTDLDDARVIHDITVRNGIIYAVGETTWATGEQDPAIWIDGNKIELDTPNKDENWGGATAFSIDFDGENIYISGNYASQRASLGGVSSACYWVVNSAYPSGKHYPLENGVSSDAFAIAILNGQPISVGWYMDEHKIIPAKWVGFTRSKLDSRNDGEAMDIVVNGNDYYISGWTDNRRRATHYYPSIWKNNQSSRKILTEATLRNSEVSSNDREAWASAILIKDGKLYAAGSTYYDFSVWSASYWTDIEFNGNRVGQIVEFNGGEMKDIAISNSGQIIIVGDGAVWIDNQEQFVEETVSSYTNTVFIVE